MRCEGQERTKDDLFGVRASGRMVVAVKEGHKEQKWRQRHSRYSKLFLRLGVTYVNFFAFLQTVCF